MGWAIMGQIMGQVMGVIMGWVSLRSLGLIPHWVTSKLPLFTGVEVGVEVGEVGVVGVEGMEEVGVPHTCTGL